MSKSWHESPLWWKVFMGGDIYLHAGQIVGHLGCTPAEFLDAAKTLPDWNQYRYENAVRDLTVYATREQGRYELTSHAKKVLRIIIGPAPDDPEYVSWWRGRLISVRQMQEEGTPVRWAEKPPVPLPGQEPAKEPPKKPERRPRRKSA